MAVGRVVSVFLTANTTGFVSGMAAANRSAATLSGSLNSQNAGFSTLTKASVGFGLAAAVAVGSAVSAFSNFDAAMSEVAAATLATGSELDALGEAALDAGETTVFSATEAAGAITELAKAGVSSADIMGGALTGALDLAAAGELEVADAAAIAASALTIFNLEGSEVPHVADLLAAAAGKAQGSVSDMGAALNQSGLVAAQMGLSIEETTGTLAAFASAGLIGSDAGTSFRSMLLRLANPTDEASGLMDELGIATYDAQGNFIGMEALAGELRTSLSGLTEEQRASALATIFGSDAIRAASILYEEGAPGIATWNSEVNDAGYAAEQAAIKTDNLKGDLERLGGAFDSLLITIGGGFDDALRAVVQAITALVDGFNNLDGTGVEQFFAAVGETAGNLWQILVNLWDSLGPVIVGFAELAGGAVIGGLSLIADALSAITGFLAENADVVTVLALTVGGLLVANFLRAQVAAVQLAVTVAALNGSTMAGVIGGTMTLSTALGAAKVAARGLVTALGPVAIAAGLALAVVEIINIDEASREAEEAVDALFDSIEDADSNAEAFELIQQGIEDTTKSIEGLQAGLDDMKSTTGVGDFFSDLFPEVGLLDAVAAIEKYQIALEQLEAAQANAASNTRDAAGDFGLTEERVLALADAAGIDLTQGWEKVQGPLREAAEASRDVTDAEEATEAAVAGLEGGLLDAAEAADALTTAFEGLTGGFRSVTEAQINFEQTLRDTAEATLALANEALGPMENALDEATGSLDTHTEAGAAVFEMLNANTEAGIAYIAKLVEQGETEQAIAAEGALRQSLYDTLAAFGIVGPAADEYVNKLIGIPGEVTTLIDADTGPASAAIDALQADFEGLTVEALVGVSAGFTAEEVQAMVADVMGTNNIEATLGLDVEEQAALAEIAAITGIPYEVLLRILLNDDALDEFLSGPATDPVGVPMEFVGLDEAKAKLDGLVKEPRNTTVFTSADVTAAEAAISATVKMPRNTTVFAGGDTTAAEAAIGATVKAPRNTTVFADGDTTDAEAKISATSYFDWRALVTAYGDSSPADGEISGTAYYDWRSTITASADTYDANAKINAAAADRTSTIYVSTISTGAVKYAGGGYVGYAGGGAVQSFPRGGPVWGAGTATSDSINARLSTGEFVDNAESTSMNRAALEAGNRGAKLMIVPGYAGGGIVGGRTMPARWDGEAIRQQLAAIAERQINLTSILNLDGREAARVVNRVNERNGAR